ncbi:homocysteine S-methyltransferase family protein, partial [Streptomyces alboniger]
RAAGARLVGGCCRVGPAVIAQVAAELASPGRPTG